MKKELLVSMIKELDKLLYQDSELNPDQKPDKLQADIEEASKELQSDDELSKQTIDGLTQIWEDRAGELTVEIGEVFQGLGILPLADEKAEETTNAVTHVEKFIKDDLVTEVEGAERLKDLKDIARSNDEFKAIRGKLNGYKEVDDLRGAMMEILDAAPKEDVKIKGAPKPEKKTEPKAKMEIVHKGKEEKPKSEKKTAGIKDHSKSNKAVVYLAWKDGEEDVKKLHKLIKARVKETTITSWTRQWAKGKALPAIAKKK